MGGSGSATTNVWRIPQSLPSSVYGQVRLGRSVGMTSWPNLARRSACRVQRRKGKVCDSERDENATDNETPLKVLLSILSREMIAPGFPSAPVGGSGRLVVVAEDDGNAHSQNPESPQEAVHPFGPLPEGNPKQHDEDHDRDCGGAEPSESPGRLVSARRTRATGIACCRQWPWGRASAQRAVWAAAVDAGRSGVRDLLMAIAAGDERHGCCMRGARRRNPGGARQQSGEGGKCVSGSSGGNDGGARSHPDGAASRNLPPRQTPQRLRDPPHNVQAHRESTEDDILLLGVCEDGRMCAPPTTAARRACEPGGATTSVWRIPQSLPSSVYGQVRLGRSIGMTSAGYVVVLLRFSYRHSRTLELPPKRKPRRCQAAPPRLTTSPRPGYCRQGAFGSGTGLSTTRRVSRLAISSPTAPMKRLMAASLSYAMYCGSSVSWW